MSAGPTSAGEAGRHPSRLALDRVALGMADPTTEAHAKACAQCREHLERLAVVTGAPDFVHPSRLALDRLALRRGDSADDEATATHAAACAQCGAHLKAVQVELPVPRWVEELGAQRPTPWLGRWGPALALAALGLVAVLVTGLPGVGPEISPKGVGQPQVQVWVNRAGKVARWDGAALRPDDAFRFEVRPGPFTHLTVVELKGGRPRRVLYASPVPSDGLSPAWAVDAEGTEEEVMLLLSNAPLSDDELMGALAHQGRSWSTRWKFPKEVK